MSSGQCLGCGTGASSAFRPHPTGSTSVTSLSSALPLLEGETIGTSTGGGTRTTPPTLSLWNFADTTAEDHPPLGYHNSTSLGEKCSLSELPFDCDDTVVSGDGAWSPLPTFDDVSTSAAAAPAFPDGGAAGEAYLSAPRSSQLDLPAALPPAGGSGIDIPRPASSDIAKPLPRRREGRPQAPPKAPLPVRPLKRSAVVLERHGGEAVPQQAGWRAVVAEQPPQPQAQAPVVVVPQAAQPPAQRRAVEALPEGRADRPAELQMQMQIPPATQPGVRLPLLAVPGGGGGGSGAAQSLSNLAPSPVPLGGAASGGCSPLAASAQPSPGGSSGGCAAEDYQSFLSSLTTRGPAARGATAGAGLALSLDSRRSASRSRTPPGDAPFDVLCGEQSPLRPLRSPLKPGGQAGTAATTTATSELWRHIEERAAQPVRPATPTQAMRSTVRKAAPKSKRTTFANTFAADRIVEVKCTCLGAGVCIYCCSTTEPNKADEQQNVSSSDKRRRTLMENAARAINSNEQRHQVSTTHEALEGELRVFSTREKGRPAATTQIDAWDCGIHNGAVQTDLPPALGDLLKPHQLEGLRFLWKTCVAEPLRRGLTDRTGAFLPQNMTEDTAVGCILAHSMGLGKTAQIIIFLHLLLRCRLVQKTLILVPKSTMSNWMSEFSAWSSRLGAGFERLEVTTVIGQERSPKQRDLMVQNWAAAPQGVLIMGYELYGGLVGAYATRKVSRGKSLESRILAALQDPGPQMVVCDEGHIMKNDQAAISQALKELRTPRRVILTGTPLQNHLSEYWTMVDFIRPGYFPKKEFQRFFQSPILEGQRSDAKMESLSLMKQRAFILLKELEPFVQRRDQRILRAELPPKHEYVVFCPLTPLQKKAYRAFRQAYIQEGSEFHQKGKSHKNILYYMSILGKLGAHPDLLRDVLLDKAKRYYEGDEDATRMSFDWAKGILLADSYEPNKIRESSKLMMLMYIVEYALKQREKLLVFSQFTQTLDLLQRFLKVLTQGKHTYRLDGRSSDSHRAEHIKSFQEEKGFAIFFISVRAGGVGINLNTAAKCVLFDVSFNPALDQQAMFRCYRYGQQKAVTIYRLVSEGTPESQVFASCISKEWMAKKLVDNEVPSRSHVRGVGLDGVYEDLQEQLEQEYAESSDMAERLNQETQYCLRHCQLLAYITSQLAKRNLVFKRIFRHESLLVEDAAEAAGSKESQAYEDYRSAGSCMDSVDIPFDLTPSGSAVEKWDDLLGPMEATGATAPERSNRQKSSLLLRRILEDPNTENDPDTDPVAKPAPRADTNPAQPS